MNAYARPIEGWIGRYANDHQHPTNRVIHTVCVPLIVWSIVALLWPIPLPTADGTPGVWATAAIGLALAYYARLSLMLAGAMFAALAACALTSHALLVVAGPVGTWAAGGAVFAVAWVAQFYGHKLEGKRPSFLTDLQYLLIGPLWVLVKAGLRY
jgi:uncharacterized membrane protein YGL010W